MAALQLSVPGRSKRFKTFGRDVHPEQGKIFWSSELLTLLRVADSPAAPTESSAVEQNEQEIILYQFLLDSTDGKTCLLRKYWLDGDRL